MAVSTNSVEEGCYYMAQIGYYIMINLIIMLEIFFLVFFYVLYRMVQGTPGIIHTGISLSFWILLSISSQYIRVISKKLHHINIKRLKFILAEDLILGIVFLIFFFFDGKIPRQFFYPLYIFYCGWWLLTLMEHFYVIILSVCDKITMEGDSPKKE